VEGEEPVYFGVNRSKVKVTITMNRIVDNRIIRGKFNRENKSRIPKFELSYFLSNFNADFCKMIIFMGN
jgi:hypothetical protein